MRISISCCADGRQSIPNPSKDDFAKTSGCVFMAVSSLANYHLSFIFFCSPCPIKHTVNEL